MIRNYIILSIFCTLQISVANAQSVKDPVNILKLKGDAFRDEMTVEISCDSLCWSHQENYFIFNLKGKINSRDIFVSAEIPAKNGTVKIHTDKDGDLDSHNKFTIQISGANPAVDKDVFEIQDEADEATVTVIHADEETNTMEGIFSVRYFDSATAVKRLGASCHFLLKK